MLGIGALASRNQRTAGDYFLGARDLPAGAVLFSIVATETSALTVISVPGIGARGDLTFLQLALGYVVGRIAVAYWLLPGYFAGKQETAYARLESRFGRGTRRLVSTLFLGTRFLGDGVRVFAGSIPLAVVTGWSVPASIVVMGIVTLVYTWLGGLRAVVWTDVLQLVVYVAGGIAALGIAADLAGGFPAVLQLAGEAGKLRMFDHSLALDQPYTLLAGLVGGAMLSAASHGTDHLIVQRLLATRSLSDARRALVGSGVAVALQFLLFLLVGTALWAAGQAPGGVSGDELFPRFIVDHLPSGVAGLVVAGILAAAMSTLSSSINALGSSVTHDWYATTPERQDPTRLLRVGRIVSGIWGVLLILGALGFHAWGATDTPVVVLALSIASVTYGALLGTYVLAAKFPGVRGSDVARAVGVALAVMLLVVFAGRLAASGEPAWLGSLGRLAWPWYVPLGTVLTVATGALSAALARRPGAREAAG
ncbi:MAG: sodium:solute symporter [Gemmatimonadales bacterium]